MAIVRKSLKQIKAAKPKLNAAKIDATTENDIRRHMIEDGEDSNYEPSIADIYTPQVIRKRLGMTQEQFAHALRIPVATLRNWEQGRNSIDPAARSLLVVVARDPQAVLATLASDAA
jgi:putative transcriptional regulator